MKKNIEKLALEGLKIVSFSTSIKGGSTDHKNNPDKIPTDSQNTDCNGGGQPFDWSLVSGCWDCVTK